MKLSSTASLILARSFEIFLGLGVIALPLQTTLCNISLVIASAISFAIFLEHRVFHRTLSIIPISMFFFYILSLLYSNNIRAAVSSLELGLSFLFIPLLFGWGGPILTTQLCDKLMRIFAVVVILMCTLSYLRIVIESGVFYPSSHGKDFTYYDPMSRYAFSDFLNFHPTYLSIYLLFSIVVFFEKFKIKLGLKLLILAVSTLFLLILSSKNQLIIYFPIALLLLWRHFEVNWKVKTFLLLTLFSTLVFFGVQNDQIKYRFGNEINTTTGERRILWLTGGKVILDNTLFGVGIGDAKDEVNELLVKEDKLALLNYNLHNQYLDYALSFGVLGLMCFLLMLFIPFLFRVDYSFFLFVIIVGSSALTESILYRQKGLCFFLLFYGLLGINYRLGAMKLIWKKLFKFRPMTRTFFTNLSDTNYKSLND